MIKKNSNTHKIWFVSKCETKKKKEVINISFCFWNVWLFNHTHGHSLGIGASTKKLLGLGNL